MIAVTFLGSAVAAAILPWRKPEIYNASPIAKYRVAGIPLITVSAVAVRDRSWGSRCTSGSPDDVYGVNSAAPEYYMVGMYALAILIYLASWLYRRSQGIELGMVYGEIPAE